jgi:hypothetical protein
MRTLATILPTLALLALPGCDEAKSPGQAGDPCSVDMDCAGFLRCIDDRCGTGENGPDGNDGGADGRDADGGTTDRGDPAGDAPAGDDGGDPAAPDGGDCLSDCAGRVCGPDPVCGTSCGSCEPAERCTSEGACFLPGTGEHGELCDADNACFGNMICLRLGSSVGFCSGECECGTGTGCPPDLSPPAQCLWQNPQDQTCWCGYICRDSVTECPNSGEGWTCENQGESGVCLPGSP